MSALDTVHDPIDGLDVADALSVALGLDAAPTLGELRAAVDALDAPHALAALHSVVELLALPDPEEPTP